MFAKRLFNKVALHSQHSSLSSSDIDVKVAAHYGIPSTASVLAFDPIQRLLAIGTLDGRIKVNGGEFIEGLLSSSKQIPYKYLEFLHNQGFLVGITNDNTIQVWDLKSRSLACSLQWKSNITAFSVIEASHFMYAGDENGLVSTIKFEAEVLGLHQLPYRISANALYEEAKIPSHNHMPVIAVLVQPGSFGNRLLIAYEHGVIVLWDISKGQVLDVRGIRNLHLKNGVTGSRDDENNDDTNLEEKDIGTLCWASSDGSIIAVGYIDGDILLWNMSNTNPSKNSKGGMPNQDVVKLQLSSAEKRLPVITLHWSPISESSKGHDGFLFVYGGDEIGAEEVLTVMRLEWVSGNEKLRCAVRVDLTLHGTFSDMILLRTNHAKDKNHNTHVYVLTNPGELHYYDDASLFALTDNQERKPSVSSRAHPVLIPTADPNITATRLSLVSGYSSKCLTELASGMKSGLQFDRTDNSIKWPVAGGIPSQFSIGSNAIERVYIASYQDGSTRIYDATYSTLSLICVLEAEVPGIAVAGSNASATRVDICSQKLVVAVGNECGLVRIYDLMGRSEDPSFRMITESKNEGHHLPNAKGHFCRAVVCILSSAISALKFSNDSTRLAIGYDCGRIAVLDIKSLSILFITDQAFGICPVSSIIWKGFPQTITGVPTSSESIASQDSLAELMFILTTDAKIGIIDSQFGRVVQSQALQLKKPLRAISMFPLEEFTSGKELDESTKHVGPKSEFVRHDEAPVDHSPLDAEITKPGKDIIYPLMVLCCEDSIYIYSVKSIIQGKAKPIHKVKLVHSCCWTAIFNENSERRCLLLLYQTGLIELRSFPHLEPVKEFSLMSLLRWNFQPQMDKIISSSDGGEIAIVNRCEFALVSLLSDVKGFRIPESFPSLHDEVLAAASTYSTNHTAHQKKKQGTAPAVLGVFKGLKGGKSDHHEATSLAAATSFAHLEKIFSEPAFPELLLVSDHQEVELDLDDIVIEDISVQPTSTDEKKFHEKKKGKKSDRDKLLQGAKPDTEPRVRTPEEILAAYRKTGDASSSAAHARSKLVERQAKLERISKGAENLQNGAENFASLANELVKVMEERNNRKWWNV